MWQREESFQVLEPWVNAGGDANAKNDGVSQLKSPISTRSYFSYLKAVISAARNEDIE